MICASFIVLILLSVVRVVAGFVAGGAEASGFGADLGSGLGIVSGAVEPDGPGGRGGGGAFRSATSCRGFSVESCWSGARLSGSIRGILTSDRVSLGCLA